MKKTREENGLLEENIEANKNSVVVETRTCREEFFFFILEGHNHGDADSLTVCIQFSRRRRRRDAPDYFRRLSVFIFYSFFCFLPVTLFFSLLYFMEFRSRLVTVRASH